MSEAIEEAERVAYANDLRQVIVNWRHLEWARIRRKVREGTREPLASDPVSDAMVRCAWLLCHTYGGAYHVGRVRFGSDDLLRLGEQWLEVSHYGDMATVDSMMLTRLIVAAHEVAIRVDVRPGGARALLLRLHPRARTPTIMTNHPTMDAAVEYIRSRWAPCPVAIPSIEAT